MIDLLDLDRRLTGITEAQLDRLQAERDQAVRTFLQFADTCPPKRAEAAAEIGADDPTGWAWIDRCWSPLMIALALALVVPWLVGAWQIGRWALQAIDQLSH